MSSLRSSLLRLAASLPKGDVTRRALLAILAEAQRNPAQQAVRNAWAYYQGTDHVREHDSFVWTVHEFALAVQISPYEIEETFYGKAADGIERKLRTLDRQSRSWRAAYNLWVEGRTIDVDRLARDMSDSLKLIEVLRDTLVRMGKLSKDFPEAWPDMDMEYTGAVKAAQATVPAFRNAIEVLKGGAW